MKEQQSTQAQSVSGWFLEINAAADPAGLRKLGMLGTGAPGA
jgi:hypothetical protein